MFQFARTVLLLVVVVFVAPAAATAAWWSLEDRPAGSRSADWSSSGVLPAPTADRDAAVYVLAARTGGLKGALSVHSWIVVKGEGEATYRRYDKVGWGMPIRLNGYSADALWYSNRPWIVASIHGAEAARLLPQVDRAIAEYPYAFSGAYRVWPGPNSNSFVAHVLATVPELGGPLPPNATGRDFRPGFASLSIAPDWREIHATFAGLAGFSLGTRSGIEIHFMGLVAGVDFRTPALKVPALGTVGF